MKDFEDIKILAGKLFFPLLVLIGGIWVLSAGFDSQGKEVNEAFVQSQRYLIAGIVLIVASIVFSLYMLNIISNVVNYALSGVLLIVTIVLLVFNYNSLTEQVAFEKEKQKRYADTKQRMIDIKEAQMAFKQKYGKFAESIPQLRQFITSDYMIKVIRSGTVPIRIMTKAEMDSIGYPKSAVLKAMGENDAWKLSKLDNPPADLRDFVRDTIKVPVREAIFESQRYEKLRKVNKANLPFDPETFGYVPYAEDDHKFTMRIKDSDEGELMRITDPDPFDPLDPLVLGSLEEKKYNGNWSISR